MTPKAYNQMYIKEVQRDWYEFFAASVTLANSQPEKFVPVSHYNVRYPFYLVSTIAVPHTGVLHTSGTLCPSEHTIKAKKSAKKQIIFTLINR